MKIKAKTYWFFVTMSFTCPLCKNLSQEVFYTCGQQRDPNPIAEAFSMQLPKCQHCKALLSTVETGISRTVLLVTWEEVKAARFNALPGKARNSQ
jgi:hypothetical protein